MSARRLASLVLAVLTAVLLAATAVCGYSRSGLSDREAFAARVMSSLDDANVRTVLADRVVGVFSDAVAPDLLNLRPLLVPAVAALIDTPAFRRVLERALRARHRTLLEGESRFVLELGRGVRFVQDTPLGAERPAELRCSPFRGRADAPLLLLNHWIPPFPPSVRDNARIGGQELKGRFERCETERGQLPNLLAVDFYEQSDVIEISAQRNRSR